MWLEDREKNVYPKMAGYNPQLRQQTILDYDVTQPDRLPDVLRAESYAFVALPAEGSSSLTHSLIYTFTHYVVGSFSFE